jgi:hypothetical protein
MRIVSGCGRLKMNVRVVPIRRIVPPSLQPSLRALMVLSMLAGSAAGLTGCVDPPGPSPIYSRLPPPQSGLPDNAARPLTP